MMAGTKPPDLSKSICTFAPCFKPHKNKKPAGLSAASGLRVSCFSGLLSTPQRTRQMAVMMMPMSVMDEIH